MKEDDIRPSRLQAGQRVALLRDIAMLLARNDEFVEAACPACGSREARFKFEKNGFRYQDCQACNTFYVNPRPGEAVLGDFYRSSENYAYWARHIYPASAAARHQSVIVPRVERVLELCHEVGLPFGEMLEIGAGYGSFCSEMQQRGLWRHIVGIEPTPDLAGICREQGFEVVESRVEDFAATTDRRFDLIVAFEVIEHLFDPGQVVASLECLLRPGGVLILTCPNGAGFDVQQLGPDSPCVDHEHLNYFNTRSLPLLLERHGLVTLKCITPGKLDAELVRKGIAAQGREGQLEPFLHEVLFERWDELGAAFQRFIADAGMSSHMWVMARKPGAADV
ncbi:class I SAM-dependent methyltransferase [Pseudomonas solani]|uniref:class I SAM-dependent methyltransferase n=1 Tax=Pseudomonas solani TaxID=2731552 RepID=UPI003C2BAA09